jgi:membrane protease YdiL (CAAX protease family)
MPEVGSPAAPAQCPMCQCPLRNVARFCPGCGHTVTPSAAPLERAEPSAARGLFAQHWGELKRVGCLFGLLLFSSLLAGMLAFAEALSLWTAVVFSIVDALIVVGFAFPLRGELLPLLGRPRLDGRCALALSGAALFGLAIIGVYFELLKQAGASMLGFRDAFEIAGWPLWAALLLISLMPGIVEELAFRGVIQTSLERVVQPREAWLIQAALFSVLHLSPIVFPSHFLIGLCIGWMRLRSQSLYPGMLLHAGWNAFVFLNER